jgi:hypothetical protein
MYGTFQYGVHFLTLREPFKPSGSLLKQFYILPTDCIYVSYYSQNNSDILLKLHEPTST